MPALRSRDALCPRRPRSPTLVPARRPGRGLLALGAFTALALTLGTSAVAAETPFRGPPLPAVASTSEAPQRPVPIEAFYEVLRDYGTFIDSDRYGVLFCPHPDAVGADFQPYLHGHWIMTEGGWTFTSDLKISWVTDHYGRWVEAGLHNCNWAWVPGGDWGPAWVDFRVGEKVIAWRPQPYNGPRVTLRRPEATSFPRFVLPPQNFTSDSGFVAVRDGEFLSHRLDYVALTGVQLYSALRETEPLRNVRAGLNSEERDRIIARIVERKAATGVAANVAKGGGAAGSGKGDGGDAYEPAQRRRKPGAGTSTSSIPGGAGSAGVAGTAGSVRTSAPGDGGNKTGAGSGKDKDRLGLTGAQPGQTPPDRTNMSTGSSAGSPGQFSGIKIPDLPKPKQPLKLTVPKPPPPDPNERNLNPDTSPPKK